MLYLKNAPPNRMWYTTVTYGMEPLITFEICSISCRNKYIGLLVLVMLLFSDTSLDFSWIFIKTFVYFMGIVCISSMGIFVDNSRLNGQFCYYILGESFLIIMIGYIIIFVTISGCYKHVYVYSFVLYMGELCNVFLWFMIWTTLSLESISIFYIWNFWFSFPVCPCSLTIFFFLPSGGYWIFLIEIIILIKQQETTIFLIKVILITKCNNKLRRRHLQRVWVKQLK